MGFFSCPKKEDNHWWTEEEWIAQNWTDEEKKINAALPHHMWNWKQNDRVWPMCHQFRGENAFGPRALDIYKPKWKPTPPRLKEGRGITGWRSKTPPFWRCRCSRIINDFGKNRTFLRSSRRLNARLGIRTSDGL